MVKKKSHTHSAKNSKQAKAVRTHHLLRRHFPTFYEQPFFGASVLVLALVALVLFMTH